MDVRKQAGERNVLYVLLAVILISAMMVGTTYASYPIVRLDINNRNVAAETEEGFTSFTIADSGSDVNGVTIEFSGTLDSRRRPDPTGIEYEQIYRDFIFSRPGGMTVTLSGLVSNEEYEITVYAYDTGSSGTRVADWIVNGEVILTTRFSGGQPPADADGNAFIGVAQADANGMIVLEVVAGTGTTDAAGAVDPFGFMNALVVASVNPITIALLPVPADGVIFPSTEVQLQWQPGMTAVSHNIYFGEDFDDVNNATTENTNIFRGSVTDASFSVGSAGNPYPDGLTPDTTFYWRVDEDEGNGTVHKGAVWSFTVPPLIANNPNPVDTSLFNDPNIVLSWAVGANSIEHHVYFGDSLEDVQAGTADTDKGVTTEPNYAPDLLELEKTYYWRVDQFDGTTTHTGDVWSFTTTLPGLGVVVRDIWENIGGGYTLNLLTDYADYPDNPTSSEELTEFSTELQMTNYGGRIHGWLYVPVTGDYTFWLSSADQGELYLSTNDDSTNVQLLTSEPVWGSLDTFSRVSEPVSLIGGNRYYIMAIWKQGGDWDHCQVAWQGAGIPEQQIIQGSYLSPYLPVSTYSPVPESGSVDNRIDPILRWSPGIYAGSHVVYFGTDPNALEQVAVKPAGDETYDPVRLEMNSTYYWRVDEVNDADPNSPWVGGVWSFSTGQFLVVDNFEDYNDFAPDRIFDMWIDGYGITTNGSTVGYAEPDFALGEHFVEMTIVNSGNQSMPYFYDNTVAGSSEATLNLTDVTDWTDEGVEILSLWFQGYPPYLGSFTEDPAGTYTMTGTGTDIAGTSDEFHFAYMQLTGVGSITARVVSVEQTHGGAKAGIMFRNSLEPDARHASVYVTPAQGVSFQSRNVTTGDTSEMTVDQITAPQWVRIERDLGGNFIASYSDNGSTWTQIGTDSINMNATVYVGLVLSGRSEEEVGEAVFSNVTFTGNVSQGPWEDLDIGILSNDPERMYVVLDESAVVYNEDPDASMIDEWTEWRIDLQEFADQGVDLTNVQSIGIGFGDRDNPQAGGAGTVFFDDIRLYRP
jgi:hypothetical protein